MRDFCGIVSEFLVKESGRLSTAGFRRSAFGKKPDPGAALKAGQELGSLTYYR
jgi:hypothetical protein